MIGKSSRKKGQRGHAKAIKWLGARGWIAAAWPHTRWNADLFGFADIIAVTPRNLQRDYCLCQVKNTKRKPCVPELLRFKQAVIDAEIALRQASFLWFGPRMRSPRVWRADEIGLLHNSKRPGVVKSWPKWEQSVLGLPRKKKTGGKNATRND